MEISLITELARAYNFKDERFNAATEEEFIIKHGRYAGQIDVPYLCRRERISHGRVRKEIQQVFGKQKFDVEHNPNEISKRQFLEIYEFGEYPNVREWIGHFNRTTDRVLTREKLFQYLTEDNIDQRWEVTPNDSFV